MLPTVLSPGCPTSPLCGCGFSCHKKVKALAKPCPPGEQAGELGHHFKIQQPKWLGNRPDSSFFPLCMHTYTSSKHVQSTTILIRSSFSPPSHHCKQFQLGPPKKQIQSTPQPHPSHGEHRTLLGMVFPKHKRLFMARSHTIAN